LWSFAAELSIAQLLQRCCVSRGEFKDQGVLSHDVRISARSGPNLIGLRQHDRLLVPDEEPSPGAHLVTPRLGFAHHGIYVGGGNVVHYGGLAHYLPGGPVEEVSLESFMHGHTLWVRPHEAVRFDPAEVIRRARSRVGEDCYRLLSNNCEHFCEWCLHGEHRSYQVEKVLVLPRHLARMVNSVVELLPGRKLGPASRLWLVRSRVPLMRVEYRNTIPTTH
jgi:hypothetical protein